MRKRIQVSMNPENPEHKKFMELLEGVTNPSDFIIRGVLGYYSSERLATKKDIKAAVEELKKLMKGVSKEESPVVNETIDDMLDNW